MSLQALIYEAYRAEMHEDEESCRTPRERRQVFMHARRAIVGVPRAEGSPAPMPVSLSMLYEEAVLWASPAGERCAMVNAAPPRSIDTICLRNTRLIV